MAVRVKGDKVRAPIETWRWEVVQQKTKVLWWVIVTK